MSDDPFGRQPQPVRVYFIGDLRDVDYYMRRISSLIEGGSLDVVTRMGNLLIIHPRAVND